MLKSFIILGLQRLFKQDDKTSCGWKHQAHSEYMAKPVNEISKPKMSTPKRGMKSSLSIPHQRQTVAKACISTL